MEYILGVVLGGVILGVVYWLRGAVFDSLLLRQRDADLQTERDRIAAMEAADARAREQRAEELNAEARTVRTSRDAADFLWKQFPGSRDTSSGQLQSGGGGPAS